MKNRNRNRFLSCTLAFVLLLHITDVAVSQVKESEIREIYGRIEKTCHLNSDYVDLNLSVRELFIEIEKSGLGSDIESGSVHNLISLLYRRSLVENNYILLLFKLDSITKRNVEVGQYLSELQYEVALNNTAGFIEVYSSSSFETRNRIKNNLFWLFETNNQELFRSKMDKQMAAIRELMEFLEDH